MNEKKFNFVQFENVGSRWGTNCISILKHKALGLNAGFYKAENIKLFSHVQIFYDKNEKTIGIMFTNTPKKHGAFKITHGTTNGIVAVRSFFTSIIPEGEKDIKKYAGRYIPKKYTDDKIGKLFYITLERGGK